MTTRYRWEKGQEFIEIEACVIENSNSEVLIVNTSNKSGGYQGLPEHLKKQVPVSEERDLYSEVKRWADDKGFNEVALGPFSRLNRAVFTD